MNKKDLIDKISKDAKITKVQAENALNSIIGSISSALKKGEKVKLMNFGTFSVAKRLARKGRNPQSGELISIPAKQIVKFKASLIGANFGIRGGGPNRKIQLGTRGGPGNKKQ